MSTETSVDIAADIAVDSLKIVHLFGFPSGKSSYPKIIGIKTYLFDNCSLKKGSRKF